jgi:hypothetical protein
MAGNGQQFQASADINVSVFVKISGDNTVVTAGAGDEAIGVMHESCWYTPIPGASATLAVPSGQSKRVYQATESCEVLIGSADLNAGDLIKPDANGAAVVCAAGDNYSAVVTTGGLAGDRAKVIISAGQA